MDKESEAVVAVVVVVVGENVGVGGVAAAAVVAALDTAVAWDSTPSGTETPLLPGVVVNLPPLSKSCCSVSVVVSMLSSSSRPKRFLTIVVSPDHSAVVGTNRSSININRSI